MWKKLRHGVSVVCLSLAIAVCVFWIRGNHEGERVIYRPARTGPYIALRSVSGDLIVHCTFSDSSGRRTGWFYESGSPLRLPMWPEQEWMEVHGNLMGSTSVLGMRIASSSIGFTVPHLHGYYCHFYSSFRRSMLALGFDGECGKWTTPAIVIAPTATTTSAPAPPPVPNVARRSIVRLINCRHEDDFHRC